MFSLISLWHKEQLTPAELHFEETITSKPQPKKKEKKGPHKYQKGPSFIFSSMFHGFLNNPEVFFAEEKEKLKRDWVWRWELKKKYLVWFSNGREGEEKKEKEEEWLGFETGLHFWLSVRLRLSSLQEQLEDFWITRVYIEEEDQMIISI